jgi:two-component system chemotaxis response regulator CheB
VINRERIARDVIVIGGSAGGIEAVSGLLGALPATLPAAVAVVLHRARGFESVLADILGRRTALPVIEPTAPTPCAPGRVYLAPRDHHLVVASGHFDITREPVQHRHRPAIDALFLSAAQAYGPRVAGVLLSGLGSDGVRGCIAIKGQKGLTLVQAPDQARFPTMPVNALREDDIDAALPVERLAEVLTDLAHGREASANGGRVAGPHPGAASAPLP